MSPAEREQRLARSLEDYKVRRTQGDKPRPEEYAEDLADAYEEFLDILDVEDLLDELLEPPAEEPLPREFGRYTLVREIGHGSAGRVYEAIHRDLGRREAVKVLRPGFDGEGAALRRFKGEAKTLARMEHDHIVEIYDAGQVDGRPYYAMALLPGEPLSKVARSPDKPSARVLCRGLAGIADALQTLHDSGIVHRDVKPQNIMVADDGTMVLADFGLAQNLTNERMTRTGQALGTPLYMSPEQILAKRDEIDGRTDVYGLGATLYEAVAGRPVFQTEDLRALLRMIVSERPEPLKRTAPDVDPQCSDIAMKALEKESKDRYQSAGTMRDDLLRFAAGEPVEGHPVSDVRHRLRALRPFAWPIAAAVLLALAWGIWFANRPGSLDVDKHPLFATTVWMDGDLLGDAPLEHDVAPGQHRFEARYDRFETCVREKDVSAGETVIWDVIPRRVKDKNDREALALLMELHGFDLPVERVEKGVRHRGPPGDGPALSIYPAGKVRPADLVTYAVDVPVTFNDEGARLEFERDGETIHSEPFQPEQMDHVAPLPEAVRDALRPGDRVTWSVLDGDGQRTSRTIEVAAADPAFEEMLGRLEEVLAEERPAVRAFYRAKAFLQAGYPTAAYVEALGAIDAGDARRSGLGLLFAAREALGALGDLAEARSEIQGTDRWTDLGRLIDDTGLFPAEVVASWYADPERGE